MVRDSECESLKQVKRAWEGYRLGVKKGIAKKNIEKGEQNINK